MSMAGERAAYLQRPFFLDTPRGPAYALYRPPAGGAAARGNVLFVPPFNEEMNRCRSMLTLQAQALAEAGWGSLLIDLFGTGDSAGLHGDAQWSHWLDDLRLARAWLAREAGGCHAMLAIRLGAALAAQSLREDASGVRRLVLWQPVVDGKLHLTQFLRVKIAAQMDRPDLPKETTASMRAQFAAGQSVEVAGYELHPELARGIDAVRLADTPPPPAVRVLWLEQPPPGGTDLGAASSAALKAWQDAGCDTRWQNFEGPSFWQQYERVLAPQAIERATAFVVSTADAGLVAA